MAYDKRETSINCSELKTLEWGISRSMLDLIFFINFKTNLIFWFESRKVYKSQAVEWRM